MDKEFNELYNKYKNKIYSYLFYLSGDQHMAEELSQDVFLKIYINLSKFQNKSSFKTWAFSIARNTFLTEVSKGKRELSFNFEELSLEVSSKTPEDHLLNREKGDLIKEVFKCLPENYSTIILLKDREGMSYKDIGEILGISMASVKTTLFRARRKFKEIYERLGGE